MLKTRVGSELWLVHQPDHARLAGYLAAHWGNRDGFAQPGHFAEPTGSDALRQEVVQAIAEHDNGWWEWEASPAIDPADGLPLDLPDVAKSKADAGLERWRRGVPRLAEEHPYVALLISMHAYWLYAFAFDDLPGLDDALRHPLFGQVGMVNKLIQDRELTRAFVLEQRVNQRDLISRLQNSPSWSAAVEPAHLLPNVRLLQIMDALSLLISMGGQREITIRDVPRGSWEERTSISWRPHGMHYVLCDPYPFDKDPLEVYLPVRALADEAGRPSPADMPPLVRLYAAPIKTIRFELTRPRIRPPI